MILGTWSILRKHAMIGKNKFHKYMNGLCRWAKKRNGKMT